jgi:tol-pal system protein YbgF
MKCNYKSILFLILASPLLVQCVPTGQDITTLDLKLRNLDNRMLKTDQKVREIEEKSAQNSVIEQLQQKQAEISDNLDRLNMEFLQIKGQLEESSHFYQNTRKENDQTKESFSGKVNDLSDQIMLLADQLNQTSKNIHTIQQNSQTAISKAQAAEERANQVEKSSAIAIAEAEARAVKAAAMAAEAVEKANRKPEISPGQTKIKFKQGQKVVAKPKETVKTTMGPGKDLYDRALGLFRASKFNQAYRAFSDYIEQYPNSKMTPNAQFWLGDCYYNQQEYELAILEYQKVIADHQKHPKAPASLLKQGLAFEKLKDKETAIIVYRKLQEEYPKSEQVSTAQKRIDSLSSN